VAVVDDLDGLGQDARWPGCRAVVVSAELLGALPERRDHER